jgi:hypothetical protein
VSGTVGVDAGAARHLKGEHDMTYTDTALPGSSATAATPVTNGRFTRRFAGAAATVTALYTGIQILTDRLDDRASMRADWWQDALAVVIFSVVGALIAYGVAAWALRGQAARQGRTVVGLTVFGVLLAVPSFWNAAPAIVLLAAILLGTSTGVTERGRHAAARVASNVAAVLTVGLLLFLLVGIVEVF